MLKRETAKNYIVRVVERIKQVNYDDEFLHEIKRAVVFGSYVSTDKDRLGDLDIALARGVKEKFKDAFGEFVEAEQEKSRLDWFRAAYRVNDASFRYIKNRARFLSLHDYDRDREAIVSGPHNVIFDNKTV